MGCVNCSSVSRDGPQSFIDQDVDGLCYLFLSLGRGPQSFRPQFCHEAGSEGCSMALGQNEWELPTGWGRQGAEALLSMNVSQRRPSSKSVHPTVSPQAVCLPTPQRQRACWDSTARWCPSARSRSSKKWRTSSKPGTDLIRLITCPRWQRMSAWSRFLLLFPGTGCPRTSGGSTCAPCWRCWPSTRPASPSTSRGRSNTWRAGPSASTLGSSALQPQVFIFLSCLLSPALPCTTDHWLRAAMGLCTAQWCRADVMLTVLHRFTS